MKYTRADFARIERLRAAGFRWKEIAAEFGAGNVDTLYSNWWFYKHGYRKFRHEKTAQELQVTEKMLLEGASVRQIAEALNRPLVPFYRWLRDHGFDREVREEYWGHVTTPARRRHPLVQCPKCSKEFTVFSLPRHYSEAHLRSKPNAQD